MGWLGERGLVDEVTGETSESESVGVSICWRREIDI